MGYGGGGAGGLSGVHQLINGHAFKQTLADREAWPASVHEVAKSRTQQGD